MKQKKQPAFDASTFLETLGDDRTTSDWQSKQVIFRQGEPADAIFYIQKGKIKLTVVSKQGKEAVIAILGKGDFFGEGCLAGQPLRMSTAATISDCSIVQLKKAAMVRVLRDEPSFSEMFVAYLLSRNIRIEEDLVDQLFNSSEKRLARVLLLLANFGKEGKPEPVIAKLSQETLGGDRGHDPFPGELFHEQISQNGFHRIQRRPEGPQLPAQRCSTRLVINFVQTSAR